VTDEKELGAAPAPTGETSQKKRRRRHGYLGCVLAVTCAMLGLVAGRLGQLWIGFDVFSQFTLQFLAAILAFTIGMFTPRGKILVAITLFVAMIMGIGLWPYYATRHSKVLGTPEANERVLTVASFNTHFMNKDFAALKTEIQRIDADVMVLIEFQPGKLPVYAELKSQFPHQFTCPANVECDLGIISKYPLSETNVEVSWVGPEYIRASLGPDFGGLTIIGTHTTRFPHPRAQFTQVKALAKLLETINGPQIVMGDFNATPFSRITQTLATAANMTRLTNLPSWPAQLGLPQVAIDHILVSPGIRALSSQGIGNNAGSDHFPIFMKLAVPVK
jgi:endonuclease/exonuclease/phosphatase (EEP) superfamily protein YafD